LRDMHQSPGTIDIIAAIVRIVVIAAFVGTS